MADTPSLGARAKVEVEAIRSRGTITTTGSFLPTRGDSMEHFAATSDCSG